ncbi:MAG: NUDIX domain-containing protein [Chloroflexota bacterium]|nr:NUDIX domain-containing protein [Chloroflexota bacterium]
MRLATEHPPFIISIFALIFEGDYHVLLGRRRDYDIWNLPGGGLRHDETVTEGIVREVREETGLVVEVDRLVGVYSKPYKNEVALTFQCRQVDGELQPTEEAAEWRYFSVDDLPQELLPKHRERILDAARHQAPAILRVQHGPADLEVLGLV